MRVLRFKSVSFHIMILMTFVFLLVATALPIIFLSYYKDKIIISALSDDLVEQISETTIERTSNYFMPVSLMVETSSKLTELGAFSGHDFSKIEMYTLGVLRSFPQVSMFYLGDEKGNYVSVRKLPDGTMKSWIINTSVSPPSNSFIDRNAALKVARIDKSNLIDFDPRVRPWYVGAKTTGTNFWTDLYISFSSQRPTITSSYPVFGPDGKLKGIWAMDIDLDEISNFLKMQKIGKSGIEVIINHKSEIVAYPELSSLIREENGGLRPVRVEELGVEPLSAAYREHMSTRKSRVSVESGGRTWLASIMDFPKPFPKKWKIAMVVPEDDFMGGAKQEMIIMLLISAVMLGLAVLLAFAISGGITSPIRLIAEATVKIKSFNLEEKIHIPSRMKEIQLMREAISSMQKGLHAFRRYVPAELVRQLISTGEGAQLGGQKKDLTVFFADITGFTSIAELLPPENLMLHLSEYFDELTRILNSHGATVDKYIGDAIMAFWGAPLLDDDHAVHACEAGLACQEKVAVLNRRWADEGKCAFVTRIGISSGETLVGNVGSTERMNYTVMGDNVNVASRLEAANKLYGTRIIVSRATYEAASQKLLFRPLGLIAVKGKSEGQAIYELVGRRTEGKRGRAAQLCEEFTRGLNAYLSQNWDEACEIFTSLSARFPEDAPTHFYLSRCAQFHDDPPGKDWQGVEYQTSK
ncbi:MAG: adenylate/guanylate cyclase domain-containing protein [Syntrophobacteraceae bacterium]